jgi:transposase
VKRPARPTRKRLEALIVEHGGNITRVAEVLGVARQTLYTWTAQLDLVDRAGIRETPLPAATAELTTASVRIPEELWRWVRIEAITRGTTAAAIVEEALRGLRAR